MIKVIAILTFAAILVVAGSSSTARAATPTPFTASPSPTLRPIIPTATSPYQYMRPTPTPLTINTDPISTPLNLDMGSKADQLADTAINVYRVFNIDSRVDLGILLAVAVVLIGYLIKLISSTTKDQ